MKKFYVFWTIVLMSVSVLADTIVFTAADFEGGAASPGAHLEATKSGVTISTENGYKADDHIRVFGGGYSLNFSSNVRMTMITFEWAANSKYNGPATETPNATWYTVSATQQMRIAKISVSIDGKADNNDDEKTEETAGIIIYTADQKLTETTDEYGDGLYTKAFNVSITSHRFSNGTGTITFADEVTSIGSWAFYKCSGLTSITIPSSVTSIGDGAFYGCSGLTSITIPNSVTSIGYWAFEECSNLTAVTWNAKNCDVIYYIDSDMQEFNCIGPFYGIQSQITNFIIGENVESLPSYLCYGMANLTSITIPNSVTNIGTYAFEDCSGLPVENGIRYADTYLVEAVDKSQNTYAIKDGTKWIGGSAFSGCEGLTSVTIPNSVTSIGYYAFLGCSGLTSITIGNSVTSIGEYAFYGCSGLTSIIIPESVTSIGSGAFYGCSGLTSIVVESGNTKYDSRDNCNAIIETTNNTLITGCKNTVIPSSVTSIGYDAFYGSSGLTSITIPESVTSIGYDAFYGCSSLTSITIGNSVTSIGEDAFYGCSSLTSITIPNSVTSIGSQAFRGCSGLTSIIIPKSVTSIGDGAFYGCYSLTSIVWNAKNCPSAPFNDIASQITNFTIGDEVVSIPASLCSGMSQLTTIIIPNSVTSIGDRAFRGCTSLKTVYNYSRLRIDKGETTNGYVGFYADTIYNYYCGEELIWEYEDGKLVITGTGDMYDFAENAMPWYMYRDSIKSIIINDGVTSIGTYAFSGLSKRGNFTQIAFPSSLLSIGEYAFAGDSYLKSIHFGASVESIGDYAFQGCTRVSEMTCLSELTPEITSKALEDISSDAYLYVPSNYLREYQLDPNWKRFVLMTLGAETTTATDVTVTPYDNEALFTWPISDNAATYTIEITKDGVVFCTLVFNANGQLTGIAFAPARNGSHNTPSAQVSATGMSFTVTGLSTASHYAYSIQAKSANNQVIASYSGEFSTNGYVEIPTAIDDETTVNKYVNTATKLLRDGQLLILRDGNAPATYNMQGAVVNL